MSTECSLRFDEVFSKRNIKDVIFLRRFHCAPRSRQRKRSVFFYDKFTTCFALRTFDWICAWESAENEPDEGEMLVQRIDLDDDPVCAEFKFSFRLNPSKHNLPVIRVESGWMKISAKWSDIGPESPVVAELFSVLRKHEYAWGSVDALVEMKFDREAFFTIKQDQLFKILSRELPSSELTTSTTFTALEELFGTKQFIEKCDFTISAEDGKLIMPRYMMALAFEYFRNLIDAEGDVYLANVPYKKKTILEVLQYAKVGVFSLDSLDGVNDALGDFIDCIAQLRPLEHEALLYHIEIRIFEMVASRWNSLKLDTVVRLLLFARQHTLVKLFESLTTLIVDTHYNKFLIEYTPRRNAELYSLMLDQSVIWAIREQHEKMLNKKIQRVLRCRSANETSLNANN